MCVWSLSWTFPAYTGLHARVSMWSSSGGFVAQVLGGSPFGPCSLRLRAVRGSAPFALVYLVISFGPVLVSLIVFEDFGFCFGACLLVRLVLALSMVGYKSGSRIVRDVKVVVANGC